jgi:uncharacterized protein YqhQ
MSAPVEKPYVGGQAVMEGVMMRSPRCLAIAVRRPDGTIVVREDAWISIFEKLRFLRWPFFRGSVILLESVWNGIQALNFSALQAAPDDGSTPAGKEGKDPAAADKMAMAGTIALSFVLALGLFVALPHGLAWGAGHAFAQPLGVDSFAFHALDGLFKMTIFVGYIYGIGRVPEIRRVFQYHGAEHKAINAYESGLELTVENAKARTTFHPRCGTSFLLFVLVLSIFMFAAVFPFIPRLFEQELLNHLAMVFIKIPLMLPLAGLAYEINRYASKHPEQLWVQALVVPGRLMQRLTTREPTADQLEIALAAMRAALLHEARLTAVGLEEASRLEAAQPAGGIVTVFRDFGELTQTLPAAP